MRNYKEHLIGCEVTLKEALARLDFLAADAILFVLDKDQKLLGSLTDGDVRRGLLRGASIGDKVWRFIQPNPKSIHKARYSLHEIIDLRKKNFKILPVVNDEGFIINVINFRFLKSYLPVDALVMAGGRGSRLRPLTDQTPKPLLKVGEKAIIDHNIDRLRSFGIDDFYISVRYLGEQLEEHFAERNLKEIGLEFIWENEPLGTLGAVSLIENFKHNYVLITNSDILTTMDYERFFLDFIDKDADMSVVTIPYDVKIPYAVMETRQGEVVAFKEKPTYTYYSNAGIYLVKREILDRVPVNTFYNSTDLMEDLIEGGGKLISYPIREYWLDIGKHDDFQKANFDVKNLDL
ncbi:nucleotidyltransferase-like protein [Roseivirga pacifica]|uniref:Nucleotidyl transferase n=1 Tax=Roseivirga pacifica TaxID=1267423 RepID=A0A1I0N634_9BACT|nr:nucleotidyltransferase family protein [Roseivirga pacifica]RKQ50952.1 nucleotidyltransferase-like protein [Roseivirga pacifica]SEV96537.1 Nucleotidyl transferase [Roseivirga pacifica]